MPHVPFSQKNRELYPLNMMMRHPLRDLLDVCARKDTPFAAKDVEFVPFVYGTVMVNHRSTPVRVPLEGKVYAQRSLTDGMLPARSAAFIRAD